MYFSTVDFIAFYFTKTHIYILRES